MNNYVKFSSLALLCVGSVHADWALVDDMEGSNNWTNLQGVTNLATDPEDGGNTVFEASGNPTGGLRGQAYLTIPTIANGSTGTVFLRVYTEDNGGSFDWVFGASDVGPPAAGFGSYDGYGRLSDGAMDVRNSPVAGGFSEVGPASSGTWYNVWLVLNNTTGGTDDTTDFYYNTGGSATSGGTISFSGGVFRNEAADLVSLLVRNNEGSTAVQAYIDDVYVDATGENLTNPLVVDVDNDDMDDNWEIANFGDITFSDGTVDQEPDGLTDLQEYNEGTDPNDADTDDDNLNDGPELDGTSNAFGSGPTSPVKADSDDDGVNDFEENGSLNTEFLNAPTNPLNEDTDGDGMDDGYELANNNPGTALDPNDDGTADASQDPNGDRDGDTLFNIEEYDPSVGPNTLSPQTRADLADTDGDGYDDFTEDNTGTWVDNTQSGTNPVLIDTDGDGLDDGDEDLDLVFSAGAVPTNANPNLRDTDGDGYIDGFEVASNTDPNDVGSAPTRASGFTLLEDFQGVGMVVGNTYDGVNGWSTDKPGSAVVTDEPIEGGGDQVGRLTRVETSGGAFEVYKALDALGLQIQSDGTGTLFFQVFSSTLNLDASLGLSDAVAPTGFADFEAQVVVGRPDGPFKVRNGGTFETVGTYPAGTWMDVWIVADNGTDTVRVFVDGLVGETGQTEVTLPFDPVSFRNGTSETLNTLLQVVGNGSGQGEPLYVDNFYIDPDAVNLSTPAAAKPVALDDPMITNVEFNGSGDLEITFTPGGAGFILTSSNDLVAPFTEELNATYDGTDTFTVPAAFLNPGKDFFRVETE